jgi:hypothetical protein
LDPAISSEGKTRQLLTKVLNHVIPLHCEEILTISKISKGRKWITTQN